MNPIPALIIIGGAGFLLAKLVKAGGAGSLNMVFGSVDVSCSGFLCTSPIFQLNLLVQNPGNTEVVIKSLAGNVYVNGKYSGDVSFFNNLPIKANTETPFPVQVRASAISLITQAIEMIQGKEGIKAEVRLIGNVNVEGVLVPVDLIYKII